MERPGVRMGLVQFVHRTGLKVTLLVDLSRMHPRRLRPQDIVGASGLYAHTASRTATSWWLGAAKGYGPAVLYAAAALHGGPVRPSTDQTQFASRFWDRQGVDRIEITTAGYRAKFGVSPATLLVRAARAGVSARAAEAAFDDWWPAYYSLAERHAGTRPPQTPWEDARVGRYVPAARSRYATSMQDEDRYVDNPAHRAPNEAIVRPQRFGLQPVRVYFGQVRPYTADVVVAGDLVLPAAGGRPLWVVGTDAQGQPILAKTKADFKLAYAALIRARHHAASFELPQGQKRPRWPRA